jgi:hypothetical protein
MVKTLAIDCPHCNKTFEVFLSNNAAMVILNCPLCATPLIYYKTRCFVLSSHQIDRIKKSRQDTTVLKILHSLAKEQPEAQYTPHPSGHFAMEQHAGGSYQTHPAAVLQCGNYITKDDVINLRIELETCTDAKQFIDKL